MTTKKVWIYGCPHEQKGGTHNSLAEAITDSEVDFNDWDIAIDLGDHDASQEPPTDDAGLRVQEGFAALQNHDRAQIYNVSGNHDRAPRSDPRGPGWFFRKYLDPMGESPATSGVVNAERPYPAEGTWERYKFQIGNVVFLMMSDIQRPKTGARGPMGGDPGGVVSRQTFEWWRDNVRAYRDTDAIVVTCHHYLLKNTTLATEEYGGQVWDEQEEDHVPFFHGRGLDPRGTSYLYYVDEKKDANNFTNHLAANPGDCAIWLGAHTHAAPDYESGGKTWREEKWGCTFIQCAGLTAHHGQAEHLYPRSYVLTIDDENMPHEATLQQYFHDSSWQAKGFNATSWQVPLGKKVRRLV